MTVPYETGVTAAGSGRLRPLKLRLLYVAKWLGLFSLTRRLTRRAIRILCYHGIWLGFEQFAGDAMFMSQSTFARRLDIIERLGYAVIPLSDAAEALNGQRNVPASSVFITIDDGWYSTYCGMLPALRDRAMPATLYCDTAHLQSGQPIAHVMATYLRIVAKPPADDPAIEADHAVANDRTRPLEERLPAVRAMAQRLDIDFDSYLENRVFHYMTPEELSQAAQAGLDVQLHTHNHTMHDLSAGQLRREIEDNRSALAAILGGSPERFRHFCYPSGVADSVVAEELERLLIASSTTTVQGLAWPGTRRQLLPRLLDGENLTEIEFEAELCGFGEILRAGRRLLRRAPGPAKDQVQ